MPSLTEPAWKLPLADATSPDLIRLVTEEWNQFRSTCMAIDQFNVDAESFQGKDAARPDDIQHTAKNARSTPMQKKHCRHGHGAEAHRHRLHGLGTMSNVGMRGLLILTLVAAICFQCYAHLLNDEYLHEPWYMAASLGVLAVLGGLLGYVRHIRLNARRLNAQGAGRGLAQCLLVGDGRHLVFHRGKLPSPTPRRDGLGATHSTTCSRRRRCGIIGSKKCPPRIASTCSSSSASGGSKSRRAFFATAAKGTENGLEICGGPASSPRRLDGASAFT